MEIIIQKAVILVGNAAQLQEGLVAGKSLTLDGMHVQIVLADSTATPAEIDIDNASFDQGSRQALRFTNRRDIADRIGFHHATLTQIARILKDADVVIPF